MAKENPFASKPAPVKSSSAKSGITGIVAKGKKVNKIKRGTK
jgi:hypothetical protein